MLKKIFKFLLVLTILIFSFNSRSIDVSALTDGNYEYELINNNKEVRITKYKGKEEYVYLPNTIKGKKVTEIGDYSFSENKTIIEIQFNSNLKIIGVGAFEDADKLVRLRIPNSIKEIKGGYYSTGAFENCDSLKSIVIGSGLENISYNTFTDCKSLESVTIGNGVKEIQNDAFNNCPNLKTVKFGSELRTIGESAFTGCKSIETLTFPSKLKTIGECSFKDCYNLKVINFNKGLETIEYGAFANADKVEKLVIPDSVKAITGGYYSTGAFENCDSLKSIVIGSGLENISYNTFTDCKSLESVTIGNGVKEIQNDAFNNCPNLKTVKFGSELRTIGESAFTGCKSIETLTFPSKLKTIGECSFKDCYNLKVINFNKGLETIEYGAFANADKVEKLIIPDSVKYIRGGYYSTGAFEGCDNLKTVSIGEKVEYISYSTFENCKLLDRVYFLGNAPSIELNAFDKTSSNLTLYYKQKATGFDSLNYKKVIFNPDTTHINIIFNPNGGQGGNLTVRTLKGATVGFPEEVTRTGYTFVDWYTNKECTGTPWDFSTNLVQNNTTLYAKWSLNKYTLKFDARGGKTSTSSKTVSYNGQIGTLPTPTKSGYIFAGWYPAQDGSGTKYTSKSKMPARNMTLYAKWTKKLSAPSNVKASKASSTSIKVTWSKVSGAKKYEVYRATSKSGKYTKVATVTSTNYTNKKLSKGKTYYYKVVACGSTSSANSTYSTIAKASTK